MSGEYGTANGHTTIVVDPEAGELLSIDAEVLPAEIVADAVTVANADLLYASSGDGDPDGNVSYLEAATVQPFANTLVTMELTGAQLRQVLEEQWQPDGASRPFLKLGVSAGFEYSYDRSGAWLHDEPITDDQIRRLHR